MPTICCKLEQFFGTFVQTTTFTARVRSDWRLMMRAFNGAPGTPAATRAEFAFCKTVNVALTTCTREAAAAPASVVVPLVRLVAIELTPVPALVNIVLNGSGAAPAI